MSFTAWIGTDSVRDSKGIYTLKMDEETGHIRISSAAAARDAGYMALSPDRRYLYATIECLVYQGKAQAAVAAYRINADDSLTYLNEQPVSGQLAAHIEISHDGKLLFVSSYLTGAISLLPVNEDGSIAPCTKVLQDPKEGKAYPHIHCSKLSPDGSVLCAMEVGTGSVDLYETVNDTKIYSYKTGPVRPRHVTFNADGTMLYVISEICSEIYVFRYRKDAAEKLVKVQTVRTVPEDFDGMSFSAGIRFAPNGELLAASTRGPGDGDAVMLFRLQDGLLTMAQYLPTTGQEPRDFNFSPDGRYLLVGLQHSDRMAVYAVDYEKAQLTLIEDDLPVTAARAPSEMPARRSETRDTRATCSRLLRLRQRSC